MSTCCCTFPSAILSSTNGPSYTEPSSKVKVPWPTFLLGSHCPTDREPFAYMKTPSPWRSPSTHCPAYLRTEGA